MKKTYRLLTILAMVATLTSCGKKEWEKLADDYCGCITKAQEIKATDNAAYVIKFKECQELTRAHEEKIKDKNEAFDYRKKVNKCVDEAYKK